MFALIALGLLCVVAVARDSLAAELNRIGRTEEMWLFVKYDDPPRVLSS